MPTSARTASERFGICLPPLRCGRLRCGSPCVLFHSFRCSPAVNHFDLQSTQEKLHSSAEEIEATFQRANTSGLFSQDMDATVALYHARASYYRRESEAKGVFLGDQNAASLPATG